MDRSEDIKVWFENIGTPIKSVVFREYSVWPFRGYLLTFLGNEWKDAILDFFIKENIRIYSLNSGYPVNFYSRYGENSPWYWMVEIGINGIYK